MKVVHAIRSDAFAGVERHVANLARVQRDAGHQVVVIGGDPEGMRRSLAGVGVPVVPASTTLQVVQALERWHGSDVIHAHMTAAEMASVLASASTQVPLVATRHFARLRGSGLHAGLVRRFGRRIDAQISISQYVAERIDGDSTVVYPGVPVQGVSIRAAARTRIALVVQRLEPEKATDEAIRVFAAAHRADWRLDIVGDGSQRPRLEQLARDLGMRGRVRFLGHRSDTDVLMSRAGVLIAPCPVDGLGLTVLEAMSFALPVVAARAGGHLETVGVTGGSVLFEPGDVGGAGVALAELMDDPGRRVSYGEALRQRQRRDFTMNAQLKGTAAVYEAVV